MKLLPTLAVALGSSVAFSGLVVLVAPWIEEYRSDRPADHRFVLAGIYSLPEQRTGWLELNRQGTYDIEGAQGQVEESGRWAPDQEGRSLTLEPEGAVVRKLDVQGGPRPRVTLHGPEGDYRRSDCLAFAGRYQVPAEPERNLVLLEEGKYRVEQAGDLWAPALESGTWRVGGGGRSLQLQSESGAVRAIEVLSGPQLVLRDDEGEYTPALEKLICSYGLIQGE